MLQMITVFPFFKLKLLITITNNNFSLELQYYLHVVNWKGNNWKQLTMTLSHKVVKLMLDIPSSGIFCTLDCS